MIDRTTKLRWRRRFRRSKKQVEEIGLQTEEHLERHFFRRLAKLSSVRRFTVSWVLLLVLLAGCVFMQTRALGKYYLNSVPASGGIYTEGFVGNFTNANPIYASTNADSNISRLLFAGLLKYNQHNQLEGDLAKEWSVDEKGTHYEVKLRPNLYWHDGKALTSEDVAFTYQTIQNPDTKSPFAVSWQGVKITTPDPQTVVFELPNPLISFPHSLTGGIVPKHLLGTIPKSQLRAVGFNTKPIGSGPFKWEGVEVTGDTPEEREQHIGLLPFENYHQGKPKIDKITLKVYHSENSLLDAFRKRELNAIAGISSIPHDIQSDIDTQEYNVPLTSAVMVFLKMNQEVLQDATVRQALALATDQPAILQEFPEPVTPVHEPLLVGQIGYDKALGQAVNDPVKAAKLLDDAGWKLNAQNIREKNGKPLSFRLFSQENDEYTRVSQTLQKQWRQVGVDVQLSLQSESDLQTTIAFHNYDALLYGISIGADSDIFAYWHSSQADLRSPTRLNFSEYKSLVADRALEGGRTRAEPTLRAIKYHPFLEAWNRDVPAISLYQPHFLYVTRGHLAGFNPETFNSTADRYSHVEEWMIGQKEAPKK